MIEKRVKYHPAEFLQDVIEDMEMSQSEFANRIGITAKQLSLILSQQANITIDISIKLSKLLGTSSEYWMNLQNAYDKYMIEINSEQVIEKEKQILKEIDNNFLIQCNVYEKNDLIETKINKLRLALPISNLANLTKLDLYANCRTSTNIEMIQKNVICRNVWISLGLSRSKEIDCNLYNENLLLDAIDKIRQKNREKIEDIFEKIKMELASCGVKVVFMKYLKNSNTSGVVKWVDNKAILVISDRNKTIDQFWFTLFHELKHVLQKRTRNIVISGEQNDLEDEANDFAANILIPKEQYLKFLKKSDFTKNSIINFSENINVHTSILVGRLQRDGILEYTKYREFFETYELD